MDYNSKTKCSITTVKLKMSEIPVTFNLAKLRIWTLSEICFTGSKFMQKLMNSKFTHKLLVQKLYKNCILYKNPALDAPNISSTLSSLPLFSKILHATCKYKYLQYSQKVPIKN